MAIRLWAARLDRPMTGPETEELLEFLPEMRKERLLAVTDRSRWAEPLAAYGLLQLALFQNFGMQKIPAIKTGTKGKPIFPAYPTLCFSLSHTRGAVLVGLSDSPVGVDIEQLRPVTGRVRRRLEAAGVAEEDYFQNWVRYEAAVKRSGAGISPHPQAGVGEAAQLVELYPDYRAAAAGDGPVEVCGRETVDSLLEGLRNIGTITGR